ncbi:DUF317 domain-containing protein [Streptomyces canus]|uniref:DUF317 domain-containing protein n=1 Tax=Streptomyces canus TaxID=58343 RepID=UPI002E353AF7|nr:DUF317 domain-containing protein [Streptomyces canus]
MTSRIPHNGQRVRQRTRPDGPPGLPARRRRRRAYAEGPDSYLYYGNSRLAALDVGTPLAEAGWSHRYGTADISFESPDGLAEVHLRRNRLDHSAEMTGHQERWLMLAGPPGNRWYATASSLTLEGLVAAMSTALTDPAPVIRYGEDLFRTTDGTGLGHRKVVRGDGTRTVPPHPSDHELQ